MRRPNLIARATSALAAFLFIALTSPAYGAGSPPDPPIVTAAKAGDTAAVMEMLLNGADANAADENNLTALNWAASNGRLAVVQLLVQHGADIDTHASKSGWTPLMNAAATGAGDVAAYLVAHGANINAHSADGGYTPLMYAARKARIDVIALLIDSGAKINDVCDDKRTALNFADTQDNAAIGALLLAHGAVRTPLKK